MDDKTPAESARFWRLNTLSAYKGVFLYEPLAQDPEHLEAIKASKAEIAAINEKEAAIKARYNRILNHKNPKT